MFDKARAPEESEDIEVVAARYCSGPAGESTNHLCRCRAAELLVRHGNGKRSLRQCRSDFPADDDCDKWLNQLTVEAMQQRNLTTAGKLAQLLAFSRWESQPFAPCSTEDTIHQPPSRIPQDLLSLPKLRHDIDQFRYLRKRGLLEPKFDAVVDDYERIAQRIAHLGDNVRVPMQPDDERRIGHIFNRIVHIADAPRLDRALSATWNPQEVEDIYLHGGPGLVVIDDFLTPDALALLQRFCLDSTVWSGNRYADGRLGAFFFAGFNCPLLLQVAEEIRDSLPQIIGERHPLRQLWGFKNAPHLPADSTVHADFAAVNVNFWITPDTANLDPESGGLVVYDTAAPLWWDFKAYNENLQLIRHYLKTCDAQAFVIPYRQNRSIIFNSDLFHATSEIHFRPEYEYRRVNITLLYGDRETDNHHPPPVSMNISSTDQHIISSSWRSKAFHTGGHR